MSVVLLLSAVHERRLSDLSNYNDVEFNRIDLDAPAAQNMECIEALRHLNPGNEACAWR
jgi:hypothetical protein